ncbi:MAG: RNHCP domain-containing protein [Firmicutes bacterium]|nr:RNHCP domain-containing protein [Bacillota bacterium]
MTRAIQNTGFSCMKCGKEILPLTNGSYRNHCPHCLSSRHVDNKPGDRSSQCKGLMKPIGLRFNSKKGYQVVHQCTRCGEIKVNKVADCTVQPDDTNKLILLQSL